MFFPVNQGQELLNIIHPVKRVKRKALGELTSGRKLSHQKTPILPRRDSLLQMQWHISGTVSMDFHPGTS